MYTIQADGKTFYLPYLVKDGYGVLSPKLTVELSKAGSLEFTMPPNNVMYNSLHKLKTLVTVYQNSEMLFRGRVLHDDKDFYKKKQVYCEGDLSFLMDSVQRPYSYTGTPKAVLSKYINAHNARVDAYKRFVVGNVTAASGKTVSCTNVEHSTTMDEVTSKLVDVYGGYLQTRMVNGVTYIDWLTQSVDPNNQTIEFARNLIDLSEYISAEDVFTVIIPFGAMQRDPNTDKELGKMCLQYYDKSADDFIADSVGVSLFGRIEKYWEWDDVNTVELLKTRSVELLKKSIEMAVTLSIKAVDLTLLGADVDRISVGDMVRVISIPHGVDKQFQCTKIVYDLASPEQNEYTFGVGLTGLTDQQIAVKKNAQNSLVMFGGYVTTGTFNDYANGVGNSVSNIRDDLDYVLGLINGAELPVGYTKLSHIEATGAQYINTGFVPNQNTRVVMSCEFAAGSNTSWLFGAISGDVVYGMVAIDGKFRTDYGAVSDAYLTATSLTSIDKNKNVTTVNGSESFTDTRTPDNTFSCLHSLYIFGANNGGTASVCTGGKVKSCQIYDNGTLVRNFIPAINPSGVYGLYDKVNGQFYINSGTGSFK